MRPNRRSRTTCTIRASSSADRAELLKAFGTVTAVVCVALAGACSDPPADSNSLLPVVDVVTGAGDVAADVVDDASGPGDVVAVDTVPPPFDLGWELDVGQPDTVPPPDVVESPDTAEPVDAADEPDVPLPIECGEWGATTDELGSGDEDFPWGVASGSIRSSSAILWTRIEGPGSVTLTVSGGPDCEPIVLGPLDVSDASGFTVHAKVTGLVPGRLYRFVFERVGGAGPSRSGWFHTPATDDVPFAVLFAGDTDSGDPAADVMWEAMQTTGAERLLWLGDWPYADKNGTAYTLDDYRQKHATDRGRPLVTDFLRFVPIEGQWDDHEVMNDWDGKDTQLEPERVESGMRAWREWFPVQGDYPGEIYRRYALGPNVEVFQLDCRSHRDDNDAPNTAAKTMLGDVQLAWLLDALDTSTAAFKLILTSVPLDYGTTTNDQWPGFAFERDVILEHIRDDGVTGVVFLTADQHWLSVHDLPSGLKEWQVGPAGTFTRAPAPQPPEVLFQLPVQNAGLLEYAPDPPRLTFTAFDESSVPLYSETIAAGRGAISVAPSDPAASWTITGTHLFHGSGATNLPLVTPGAYTIFWGPAGSLPPPSPETLVVTDGGTTSFVGDYAGGGPTLWDPFTAPSIGAQWTIVTQGVADTTAAWAVSGGAVQETGNAYDQKTDQTVVPKLGTFLWAKGTTLGQGAFVARLYAGDDDGIGLMYAVQDKDSYYRISFDAENSFARLVRVDDGAFTVLAEDLDFYPQQGVWTTVAVERDGDVHRVYAEGRLVFEVSDGTYPSGSVALYSWGMSDARFDDVAVYPAP